VVTERRRRDGTTGSGPQKRSCAPAGAADRATSMVDAMPGGRFDDPPTAPGPRRPCLRLIRSPLRATRLRERSVFPAPAHPHFRFDFPAGDISISLAATFQQIFQACQHRAATPAGCGESTDGGRNRPHGRPRAGRGHRYRRGCRSSTRRTSPAANHNRRRPNTSRRRHHLLNIGNPGHGC